MRPRLGVPRHDVIPVLFALSVTVGAAVYFLSSEEPGTVSVVAVVIGALAFTALARQLWRLPAFYPVSVLVLGIALGLGAGKFRTASVDSPTIASEIGPVMLEGWVWAIEPGAKGPRLRLQVQAIAGLAPAQTPDFVRVTHTSRLEVSAGRFVRCWAVLRPPPAPSIPGDYDFQRQAYYQRLGAVGYVQGRCRGGTLGPPASPADQASLTVGALRRSLARHVNDAAGERAGGFAAALASGDRSLMAESDREALRNSGLAHLLAISGLHMGIVGGLIYFIVFRGLALIEPIAIRIPVQKPAAFTALFGSAIYLILSGASVSTQRAFIMAIVFFGAILVDRAAISFRSLAIAMTLIVFLQPESVMSPGFQMSFAATAALIAVYYSWSENRTFAYGPVARVRTAIWSIVKTSIVAAAATAPFALYHFDRLAGLGLVANVLAMPIVSFISAPAAAVSLLLAPLGASEIGLRAFGLSLEAVLAVAHWCSSIEGQGLTPDTPMPGFALGLLILALVGFLFARGFWRFGGSGLITLAAAFVWVSDGQAAVHLAPNGDVYLVEAGYPTQRVAFADGDGLAPLRYTDQEMTQDCAQAMCEFDWNGYHVRLTHELPACDRRSSRTLTLTTSEARSACRNTYSWQAASQARGLTLSTDANGDLTASTPPCGQRPWRPCPP